MGFGSVFKCIRAFSRQTAKKNDFNSPGYIYLRFTVASSHYNSSQKYFSFFSGVFSLNQFGGCGATIFSVIAPVL